MLKAKISKFFKSKYFSFIFTKKLLLLSVIVLFPPLLFFSFYNFLFWGKIFPGVTVVGVNMAGLKPQKAKIFLTENIKVSDVVILNAEEQVFNIPLSYIDYSVDFEKSVIKAFRLGRSGNMFNNFYFQYLSLFKKHGLEPEINYNEEKLSEILLTIDKQISKEPKYPLVIHTDDGIRVDKGEAGSEVDSEQLKTSLIQILYLQKEPVISVPVLIIDPTISDEEADLLFNRALKFEGKKIILAFEGEEFGYGNRELVGLLDPRTIYNEEKITSLVKDLSEKVNRTAENPVFVFEGGKVEEFAPATDGVSVGEDLAVGVFFEAILQIENSDDEIVSRDLPFSYIPSDVKTEEVNNLGIKELLGKGSSSFRGSISSRVHNISLSSSKINGTLVAPGDTFSFNDTLGDVSSYTGYRQAYIIRDGKTVLGDGGGVCQVSTTMFRAILDSGLPVVERRAHSYRVNYYEQDSPPGLDATVYSPVTDLRFKNDTPAHLLIQARFFPKESVLVFEIYGTSDGRVSTITKPIITDVSPPPEDLFIDDLDLFQGEVKQIDWKAWGAKVRFDYSVEKNGEIFYQKTFYSNYQPWQAKFLVGTGPVQ